MSTSNLAPVVPTSLALAPVVAASFACASTGPTTQIAPTAVIRGNQLLFTDKPPSAIHAPTPSGQAPASAANASPAVRFASLQGSCQKAAVGGEQNENRAQHTDR